MAICNNTALILILAVSPISSHRLSSLPATTGLHKPQQASPINHRSSSGFWTVGSSLLPVWAVNITGEQPTRLPRSPATASQTGNNNNNNQLRLVQWSKEAVQYYEGSTLVLSCSLAVSVPATGGPLKFTWFKANKALQTNMATGRQLSIETLPDYSFLRLSDLRPSDSGAYSCQVSNSLGQEDRTSTQVIVNGEFN